MDMEITFAGNKRVGAEYKGFRIETDQPVEAGGDGTALSPFDLFLVSLGTCAGFFVLQFMQQRNLSTDDARVIMSTERDPETRLISKIKIDIKLPADFPEKYKAAVIRAAELCTVKRHLEQPPTFEIQTTLG
ncbi:MAG TPA: OsmC family protein [Candidatus Methylomirabilis sp.]|nr:OsmC family protein [Candidatus Methylomirabilis sp.]